MPIYEYQCNKCGEVTECLVLGNAEKPACGKCGSSEVSKIMSAHSTTSVSPKFSQPAGSCCGGGMNSCGNPGSCCSG